MREDNEALFRRWVEEVWNRGIETTIDELLDKNVVAAYQYNIGSKPIRGKSRYKRFVRLMRCIFENISITIEQISSDQNKVIALCEFSGSRRANDRDAGRTIKGLCQFVISNGKIVHIWNNVKLFDSKKDYQEATAEIELKFLKFEEERSNGT